MNKLSNLKINEGQYIYIASQYLPLDYLLILKSNFLVDKTGRNHPY